MGKVEGEPATLSSEIGVNSVREEIRHLRKKVRFEREYLQNKKTFL